MIEKISNKCIGCGFCVLACRKNLIKIRERGGKKIAYFKNPEQCVVCYACHANCPVEGVIYVNAEKPKAGFQKHVTEFSKTSVETMRQRRQVEEGQDIVVVGAGCAGLVAAIAASEAGASCVVLEKAPDITDTNTSRAGGTIPFAMECEVDPGTKRFTPDEKVKEAFEIAHEHSQPSLIRACVENIDGTIEWLKKKGLQFHGKKYLRSIKMESWAERAVGSGAGLNKQLLSMAEHEGCRILFNTRAEKLLRDKSGAISGVRARTVEGIKDFKAKAVVMATAGFQANQEMLHKYIGSDSAYKIKLTGSPFSTGDGHIMAQEVGAKLVNMDVCHSRNVDSSWVPGSSGLWGPVRELRKIIHYCIFVNKLGKRFMDEVGTSNTMANSILFQPGQEIAIIFDEAIKAINPREVDGYRPKEMVLKYATLRKLATGIGLPYNTLKKTIDEFNDAIDGDKALSLDVSKRACSMPVKTPPFYVIYPVWCGLNCTLGGPLITNKAEVVDRDDVPIPGLYACGEMTGGFYFGAPFTTVKGATYCKGTYQVTSASLATCVVFGHIAGTNAARLSLPGKKQSLEK